MPSIKICFLLLFLLMSTSVIQAAEEHIFKTIGAHITAAFGAASIAGSCNTGAEYIIKGVSAPGPLGMLGGGICGGVGGFVIGQRAGKCYDATFYAGTVGGGVGVIVGGVTGHFAGGKIGSYFGAVAGGLAGRVTATLNNDNCPKDSLYIELN